MAVDRIDDFVDLQATGAQKDALLGQINEVYGALKKVSGMKISFEGGASLKDAAKLLSDIAAAQNDLDKATSALKATQAAAVKTTQEMNAVNRQSAGGASAVAVATEHMGTAFGDAVKDAVRAKAELERVNAALKEMEVNMRKSGNATALLSDEYITLKEDQAILNEVLRQNNVILKQNARELVAAEGSVDELTASLDRLQNAYRKLSAEERASAEGDEMLRAIQVLDPTVKGFNETMGNFQRSVGNYEKASSNFSNALTILRKELASVESELVKHNNAANRDAEAIANLTRNQKLLNSILVSQETGFATTTAEIRNNEAVLKRLSDAGLRAADVYQKLHAETVQLKADSLALQREIRAQAATYSTLDGVIQGAQALAGSFAIAQGAAALFGSESEELEKTFVKLQAVMTVINGLQAVQTALRRGTALSILLERGALASANIQLALNSAATSKNIVLKYAAIVAQKAYNAVVGGGNPYLKAALLLLGLLAAAYAAFANTQKDVIANFKQMNEDIAASNAILDSSLSSIKNNNEERTASLRASFATEAQLREENIRGMQEESAAVEQYLVKNRAAYDAAVDLIRKQAGQRARLNDSDRAAYEEASKIYENFEQMAQRSADIQSKIRTQQLNDARSTSEEQIKVEQNRIQILVTNSNTLATQYKKEADDATKSYAARIAASNKFSEEQKRIVKLETQSTLLDRTLSDSQKAVTRAAANAKLIELERQRIAEEEKLNKEESNRLIEAAFNTETAIREMRVRSLEGLAANEKKSDAVRLQALIDAGKLRIAQVQAEGNRLLLNDKLIGDERVAIEQETQNKLSAVMLENAEAQRAFMLDSANRLQERFAIGVASRAAALKSAQASDLVELNRLQEGGIVSADRAARLRTSIELKYQQLSIQNELNAAQARTNLYKQGTQERADAERELAELVIQLSDTVATAQRSRLDSLAGDIGKVINTVNDVTSIMGGFLDASITKQKNAIADNLKAAETAHRLELSFIAASTASSEDKAAKTIIAEARVNAARKLAEDKQKEQDQRKAEFDKANTIAQIILSTALAVVKSLPNIPLAVASGAFGAAQLAVAVATPVPRYAVGTDNHPGGPFIAGDGGRPEVVLEPGKRPFVTPARDTLYYGAAGTKVLPSVDEYNAQMHNAAIGQLPIVDGSPIDEERLAAHMLRGYDRVVHAIASKQEVHFSWSNGELKKSIKNGNSWTNYVNKI